MVIQGVAQDTGQNQPHGNSQRRVIIWSFGCFALVSLPGQVLFDIALFEAQGKILIQPHKPLGTAI